MSPGIFWGCRGLGKIAVPAQHKRSCNENNVQSFHASKGHIIIKSLHGLFLMCFYAHVFPLMVPVIISYGIFILSILSFTLFSHCLFMGRANIFPTRIGTPHACRYFYSISFLLLYIIFSCYHLLTEKISDLYP